MSPVQNAAMLRTQAGRARTQSATVRQDSPQLRLAHPVRLLNAMPDLLHRLITNIIQRSPDNRLDSFVARKDLHTPDMRILAILMVFHNAYLQEEAAQYASKPHVIEFWKVTVSLWSHFSQLQSPKHSRHVCSSLALTINAFPLPLLVAPALREVDIDPALRTSALPAPFGEFNGVVLVCSGGEGEASWRVGLVEFEIEVDAKFDDAHELEEVNVEEVGLRAVRLPEGRG